MGEEIRVSNRKEEEEKKSLRERLERLYPDELEAEASISAKPVSVRAKWRLRERLL